MKTTILTTVLVILGLGLFAQVSINTDGSEPDGSAMLDVKSTDKGLLPPRMTQTQRDGISSPATGLIIFQTDGTPGYYYYTGADWISITSAGPGGISTSSCIDYDGNAYPTMTIGEQVWMSENLRVTHYRNGDAIPNVTTGWNGLSTGAYCWYDNDQTIYEKYGALYNWYTVNDSRGLCPEGWHVPTGAEWTTLSTYLGGSDVAGGKMKATSDLWNSPNTDANNSSSFSGLPGGNNIGGTFNNVGGYGYWWSSTPFSPAARYSGLSYQSGEHNMSIGNMRIGFSVRCLRD